MPVELTPSIKFCSRSIVHLSRENNFTSHESPMSLPRRRPLKRISQGAFSCERSQMLLADDSAIVTDCSEDMQYLIDPFAKMPLSSV